VCPGAPARALIFELVLRPVPRVVAFVRMVDGAFPPARATDRQALGTRFRRRLGVAPSPDKRSARADRYVITGLNGPVFTARAWATRCHGSPIRSREGDRSAMVSRALVADRFRGPELREATPRSLKLNRRRAFNEPETRTPRPFGIAAASFRP